MNIESDGLSLSGQTYPVTNITCHRVIPDRILCAVDTFRASNNGRANICRLHSYLPFVVAAWRQIFRSR